MSKRFTYQTNNHLILKTVLFSLLMILLLAKPLVGALITMASDDMELCETDVEEEKEIEDDQLDEIDNFDFQESLCAESLFVSASNQDYCSVLFSKDPQEVVSPPPEA